MTTLHATVPEFPIAKDPEAVGQNGKSIRSLIPARLDRLGWSRFHTTLVVALGVAWVLDGLQITIGGIVEMVLGVSAERRFLEDIASPLSSMPADSQHLSNLSGAPPPPSARASGF